MLHPVALIVLLKVPGGLITAAVKLIESLTKPVGVQVTAALALVTFKKPKLATPTNATTANKTASLENVFFRQGKECVGTGVID